MIKKFKNKKLLAFISIVVLIVIFTSIGAFIFNYKKKDTLSSQTSCKNILYGALGYSVYSFNKVNLNSINIYGKIAAANAITLTNFTSKDSLYAPIINLTKGTIDGSIEYSDNFIENGVNYTGSKNIQKIKINSEDSDARNYSNNITSQIADIVNTSFSLSKLKQNSSVKFENNVLTLNGYDKTENIFDINASDFQAAKNIEIYSIKDSFNIINVSSSKISLEGMGIKLNNILSSNVLFNFIDSYNISLSNIKFSGTILAPKSSIMLKNTDIDGEIISTNVAGNGNININSIPSCLKL